MIGLKACEISGCLPPFSCAGWGELERQSDGDPFASFDDDSERHLGRIHYRADRLVRNGCRFFLLCSYAGPDDPASSRRTAFFFSSHRAAHETAGDIATFFMSGAGLDSAIVQVPPHLSVALYPIRPPPQFPHLSHGSCVAGPMIPRLRPRVRTCAPASRR